MSNGKKVLIVEDDKSIARLQKDYLEMSGFSADTCGDGRDGLKFIMEKDYDLAILDVMLPGLDGLEILKRVREVTDMPVLIVSAKKDEVDKIRGLGLGADDYITKPFSPGELIARVNAHITKYERLTGKNGAANNGTIIVRGLELQKDSRRVFVNGTEINMAQKEFDLLLFMLQNPNRVFNREELFDRIWGVDSLGDAATVTVHIARIRDKIESNPSNPQYIETVWGAGYRFRA